MSTCRFFQGPQGKGKSTMLRILGGEWYAETPFQVGDKDAYQQLQGTWLYGSRRWIRSINREHGRQGVRNDSDRSIPRALRTVLYWVDRPRQCVFAGNTNHSEYFKDTNRQPALLAGAVLRHD